MRDIPFSLSAPAARLCRPFMALLTLLAAVMAGPSNSLAAPATIEISRPWARPSLGGNRSSAAYLAIVNHAGQDDHLVRVGTVIAGRSEVHLSSEEKGVMQMRPIPDLTIRAGETVMLRPGALHIMLFDLTQALKVGDSFPLELTFAQAGSVVTQVTVLPMGSSGPAAVMK